MHGGTIFLDEVGDLPLRRSRSPRTQEQEFERWQHRTIESTLSDRRDAP
jgi:transcriptional regulator with GAF, ATPase, and Fis domain